MRNNDKKGRGGNRTGGSRQKPYFSHEERDSDKPQRGSRERSDNDRKGFGAKREGRNDNDRDNKRSSRDDKGFGRKRESRQEDRGERKSFRKDDDRKSYGERSGRSFDKKKSYGDDDRSERKSFRDNDDRKSYGERSSRSFDKKKSYGDDDRGERKSFRDNDDRKSYGERSNRSAGRKKSYGDDDRGERKSSRSNEERKTRKGYGEEAGASSFKKRGAGDDRRRTSPRKNDEHFDDFEEDTGSRKGSGKKTAGRRSKDEDEGLVRLNRYIANAGICSRREADDLIKSGVVSVNGKIITEMGYKVTPGDVVRYNNETLKRERHIYVLLNKPKDYITTLDDPGGRKTVLELVQGAGKERIYPVGRLDRATTGLLLLTNDGELTKRLTHPRYGVQKVYHVELDKNLKPSDMEKIAEGIELEDGMIKVDDIAFVGDGSDKTQVGIELHSGRNRIVRRIFEHLGYNIRKLDRVSFAGLTKKDLPRGRWRHLSEKEVGMLYMVSQEKNK